MFRRSSGITSAILIAAALAFSAVALPTLAKARAQPPHASIELGRIPFTEAAVNSADGRTFSITWSAPVTAGSVEVFARSTADTGEGSGRVRSVGHGPAQGRLNIAGLPAADRWYFELRPRHGQPLVIADRNLHLASAPNFRDIGGYRTTDGRWIRMGLAYRSDQLDRLSDADLAKLRRLAPALVVDLRTEAERQKGPDRAPPGAETMVADVLADSPPDGAAIMSAANAQAAEDFLIAVNRQFVTLGSARQAYSRLFARLGATHGPVVYHCTAGKDRTGWASAVLLTALGASRRSVMADYLASNDYLAEKNRATLSRMPPASAAKLEAVLTVRPADLQAAFDEVDRRYGSFDSYLHEGLGLDDGALGRLRAYFLAGAPQ